MNNMEIDNQMPSDRTPEGKFSIPVIAVIGLPLLTLLILVFIGFGLTLRDHRSELTKAYSERMSKAVALDLGRQLSDLITPVEQYVDGVTRQIKAAGCKTTACVNSLIQKEYLKPDLVPLQIAGIRFGGMDGRLNGAFRYQEKQVEFAGRFDSIEDNPSRFAVTLAGRELFSFVFDLYSQGWYQAGMIGKSAVWSAPYHGDNANNLCQQGALQDWSLTRIVRIDDPDGKPLGVLGADMCINEIGALFKRVTSGHTVEKISIITPSTERIFIENEKVTVSPALLPVQEADAIPLGSGDLHRWRVAVTLDPGLSQQIAWDWRQISLLLAGFLISIILTALTASLVVKPLMKLSRAVTDVGDLKLETPISISTGIKEIGLLASVIERMRFVLHRNQTRLEFLAYHDPVTGFLNREGLARAFDLASTREGHVDLILIKVRNYHQIASVFGDAVLTRLLIDRINTVRTMFEGGVVGCLNNNQIACIFQSSEGIDIAHMQQVLAAMRLPYEDNGIRILLNIAGSVSSKHGQIELFDSLLRRANEAMHYAEETKSEDAVWYNPALIQDLRAVLDFGGDITQAIARGEFLVVYQPIVELRTGQIVEAQASVVWHHPEFGEIRSHKFMPILKRNGSIRHLGLFVMSRAFEFLHDFKRRSPDKKLLIGVKLSYAQLMDPLFVERVTELQAEWNISAPEVNFIITQNTAMLEDQQIFRVMRKLRKLGFSLTIDQFAMAHSTVNGTTALQYDGMMIGPDVYRGIEQPGVERIILEAACELARKLGMERIAVGIDNHAIIQPLIECGCSFGRGPWFGKSIDEQTFLARYDENAAMFTDEVVS
ncbi:EAL domain-containing protein [Phyllobacterium sp. YR531]|uniref:EAL domain-containing protein n=1 Tax=Phyllobacterium sp. YR531 TaxID=1144343 RepID=UPI00026FBB31|nr:EAL domain-containing protein [Phyllobacterium sp. YR531]EJN02330.1 EAL domain-containing protein [Phyllobacterium sp. YR531]